MTLTESLKAQTKAKEQQQFQIDKDPNRLKLHLMPPVGWINDPNGLCQFHGKYHVFYQYSPLDPNGSMKAWGHYESDNLLDWKQLEAPLFPDQPFDKDGVYSGSAFIENDEMYLFYTGNVKQEGEHDYDYSGREANTVLVTSKDGEFFNEKELLMTNADYPSEYTCHIRDPKIWKEGDTYYMIQGGRKMKYPDEQDVISKNSIDSDYGTVLIFESKDLHHWKLLKDVTSDERFGYMWECPDYFKLKGRPILSFSPQGIPSETNRFQNVYQSGYLVLENELTSNATGCIPNIESFKEWDMGFDFYAPQTFQDEKGRRILIGWAGIGDADYDNQPTVEKGWQHALTLPRELAWKDGKVFQNPVEELKELRSIPLEIREDTTTVSPVFEVVASDIPADFRIMVGTGIHAFCLNYEYNTLKFSITKDAGRGRQSRQLVVKDLRNIRMIMDTSMVEFYINDGEYVLTSRFYFPDDRRDVVVQGAREKTLYYLDSLNIIK